MLTAEAGFFFPLSGCCLPDGRQGYKTLGYAGCGRRGFPSATLIMIGKAGFNNYQDMLTFTDGHRKLNQITTRFQAGFASGFEKV